VHPSTATFRSPELLAIAEKDGQRFESEHHWLLRVSRLVNRWKKRLHLMPKDQVNAAE
jgi:hypothetical protein